MLHKSNITKIQAGTTEWRELRLGKFTSSDIHLLMGTKGIGKTGLDYIYRKVGESITGRSDEKEYGFVEQMEHGLKHEALAVREFANSRKADFIVVQTTVNAPNSMFLSTPDSVLVLSETTDELGYNVETLEVKCPFKFHTYIQQRMCVTPQDLKKTFENYYWQVLDQMLVCGASVGYFYTYNPDFPEGNRGHTITFRQVEVWDDMKLLQKRKAEAAEKFKEIKQYLSKSVSSCVS